MNIDKKLNLEPHHLKEMVKVKVQYEAIPNQIKKGIAQADKVFGNYMQVNEKSTPYDFGAGYYLSVPHESRGSDLLKYGKNPLLEQITNETTILGNTTMHPEATMLPSED